MNCNILNRRDGMINSQERAKLISLSHALRDLVFVGKENITDTVVAQINDNLYAHELIKIKVNKNVGYSLQELADEICEKCDCILVAIIGNKIVVYKETTKPKFAHLLKK